MAAIRADRWPDAQRAAGAYADQSPQAGHVTGYSPPSGATADEITDFMAQEPRLAEQALLGASASGGDRRRTRSGIGTGAMRTQYADLAAGRPAHAEADAQRRQQHRSHRKCARRAWLTRSPSRLRGQPSCAAGPAPCRRTISGRDTCISPRTIAPQRRRSPPGSVPSAQQRRALRGVQSDGPNAETLLAALPAAMRTDRRHDAGSCALAARPAGSHRRRAGLVAPRAAPRHKANAQPDRLAAFWTERNLLARRLLQDGDAAGAYALASDHGAITPEQTLDAEFLAGLVALRQLNNPAAASQHFATLRWPGYRRLVSPAGPRALLARSRSDGAGRGCSAGIPTGGGGGGGGGGGVALALGNDPAALAHRITPLHDPAYTRDQVLAFYRPREVVRAAAAMLVAWNKSATRAHLSAADG